MDEQSRVRISLRLGLNWRLGFDANIFPQEFEHINVDPASWEQQKLLYCDAQLQLCRVSNFHWET